jgi:hypothetical protein
VRNCWKRPRGGAGGAGAAPVALGALNVTDTGGDAVAH